MPFRTAIAGHFLISGEKLTFIRVAGLLIAMSGIILVLSDNDLSKLSTKILIGDIFCLIAAMVWSGIVIVTRTTNFSKACPEMQLIYQLVVSSLLLLMIAPFVVILFVN